MQTSLVTPNNRLARDDRRPALWRWLNLLNYYRLALSLLPITLYFSNLPFKPLGSHHPQLFIISSALYFLAGVIIHQTMRHRSRPGWRVQIRLGIGVDIGFVVALMHAGGGIHGGLAALTIVPIAAGSLLLSGRARFYPALFASIAIFAEQGLSQLAGSNIKGDFMPAAILGIAFFATSWLAVDLSRRIRESGTLTRKQDLDLADMARLTGHVIQRMQTGVIVVDADLTIRLINASAWQMLGMPASGKATRLSQVSRELLEQLLQWQNDPFGQIGIKPITTHIEIQPRFARLGQDTRQGVLIFLEDISATTQQAQQLQLASLGQLTASIAHEIRNPLGAISHAGQLLSESDNLDDNDRRLTQIIADNTSRLNTIVQNVMQVSRRDPHHIELISLQDFLQQFIPDYRLGQAIAADAICIDIHPAEVQIRFDTSHLRQILVNLCDNALRHSADYPGTPRVELRGGIATDFNRPFLDVFDHGPGIRAEDIPHIFEPFFTSSTNGTGLGLYISRQLAESNQAHLNYIVVPTGGACFRISFQDPRRNIH